MMNSVEERCYLGRDIYNNYYFGNQTKLSGHNFIMKWITREKPKIDRIACPWLIKRFIDPGAEIIYVPFQEVKPLAKKLEAIPFDIPDVEYTHYKDECSFDYF